MAREEGKEITDYAVIQLGAGWYLDYTWHERPDHPATTAPPGIMDYLPMIRSLHFSNALQRDTLTTTLAQRLKPAVTANPGATWLIGNEPDNLNQDNQTPTDLIHCCIR